MLTFIRESIRAAPRFKFDYLMRSITNDVRILGQKTLCSFASLLIVFAHFLCDFHRKSRTGWTFCWIGLSATFFHRRSRRPRPNCRPRTCHRRWICWICPQPTDRVHSRRWIRPADPLRPPVLRSSPRLRKLQYVLKLEYFPLCFPVLLLSRRKLPVHIFWTVKLLTQKQKGIYFSKFLEQKRLFLHEIFFHLSITRQEATLRLPLENGKKSAGQRLFSPQNHIDFDFKRYSSIWARFWLYSNVERWMFSTLKNQKQEGATSAFLNFFQNQKFSLSSFESIQKQPKLTKSIDGNQSLWLEGKKLLSTNGSPECTQYTSLS